MSSLLAIDSGHPECAVAAARDRILWRVDTMTLTARIAWMRCAFDQVIVEVPQADGRAVPVDDLIRVATTGVRLAERAANNYDGVREVRPREWKGSTPKPPHHNRMWGALTADEMELLGGSQTAVAIARACERGARDGWRKPGATYYRARELPTAGSGGAKVKITHDILDASALALYALGRIRKG